VELKEIEKTQDKIVIEDWTVRWVTAKPYEVTYFGQ
jgi:hypothetical protein